MKVVLGRPALEDVDAPGLDEIGGQGEIQAAGRAASGFHDLRAPLEVCSAVVRVDDQGSCDDDH
jgi:hypothetical protein